MRRLDTARTAATAALATAAGLLAGVVDRVRRVASGSPDRRRSTPPTVTAAEREAAWAARAAAGLLAARTEQLEAVQAELAAAAEHIAQVEMFLASTTEQLATARRRLAHHTATANENHRLRGAIDALTEAMAALHRAAADGSAVAQAADEADALRAELVGLEAQVKELAGERDRAVDEVDRLRAEMEAAKASGDDDRERRLRAELDHVRRSLDIERDRNLRLGRRLSGTDR